MEEIIKAKLKEIEEKENVKIILAVESGSRAWGFASKDSDYDVRFVYVRRLEDYLKLENTRDVIEWQLDDTLDINGWDVKKALQLMYESNPSIFEWLSSPIVYRDTEEFKELREISHQYYSEKKSLYHYLHMASSNYKTYIFNHDEVRMKKYFYVLRPILCARYIARNKKQPPMVFDELVEKELPSNLRECAYELLEKKKNAIEMESGPRIKELDAFIDEELISIKEVADKTNVNKKDWQTLNAYFIKLVRDN